MAKKVTGSKSKNVRLEDRRYVIDNEVIELALRPSDATPEVLLELKSTTKLIYFYHKTLEAEYFDFLQSELAEALGVSRQSVMTAMNELEEHQLLVFDIEQAPRVRPVYRII